ncbi:hypothetical protein QTP88_003083 [Uroleucon formosanum]
MENVCQRIKIKLVSSEKCLQKHINKSTFKQCTTYNGNLAAVSLENKEIKFDKPIFIGFAVLDMSKTLIYEYHYDVMQKHYGEKIELMYTDTDDFYQELANNANLLDKMDTANLPKDHPCYIADRKKIPGFFSEETDGLVMTEDRGVLSVTGKIICVQAYGTEKINPRACGKEPLDIQ